MSTPVLSHLGKFTVLRFLENSDNCATRSEVSLRSNVFVPCFDAKALVISTLRSRGDYKRSLDWPRWSKFIAEAPLAIDFYRIRYVVRSETLLARKVCVILL